PRRVPACVETSFRSPRRSAPERGPPLPPRPSRARPAGVSPRSSPPTAYLSPCPRNLPPHTLAQRPAPCLVLHLKTLTSPCKTISKHRVATRTSSLEVSVTDRASTRNCLPVHESYT